MIGFADATEGKQVDTFTGEKELILKSIPMKEAHPVELLAQWEMELKELEDWLDSLELEGVFREISMREETYQPEL
jgi:hypothetical protein